MHLLHEVCICLPYRVKKNWHRDEYVGHSSPQKGVRHEERKRVVSITMTGRHIEEEKAVVEQMIRLYCRKREGHAELCPRCRELLDYAHRRLDRCRFGEDKPTCKKCPVHCYRPEMKERIREVMRWSGPRMIFHHPLAALRHLLREIR